MIVVKTEKAKANLETVWLLPEASACPTFLFSPSLQLTTRL